jgi:cell wall assembly regulator SMI1
VNAEELVARLDRWMQKNRPQFLAGLPEGATPAELKELEEHVGKTLPEALKVFLAWKGESRGRLVRNFGTMSVEQILGERQGLNDLLDAEDGDFDLPSWWRKDWVPFLENGAGDFRCVDLGGAFGGVPGQVLEYWHDYDNRTIQYPSFVTWLSVFVETLEAGLWDGDEKTWDVDEKGLKAAQHRACPGYPKKHSADEGGAPEKPKKRRALPPEIEGQITEEGARRLLAVWLKRGWIQAQEATPSDPGGFHFIDRMEELRFDPARKTLSCCQDLGPAPEEKYQGKVHRELFDREREKIKAADPRGDIEIRQFRFRTEVDKDARPAYVLVREFGDPSMTGEAFDEAWSEISHVLRHDWELKFSWAVQAEEKKRGLS